MDKKGQFFERLFEARYHSVYSFFLKKLGSPEDTADASRETFMRMVRHNGTAELDSPDGYIWRTTQNLVSEIKRTRAIRARWMAPQAGDFDEQVSQAPVPEEAMKLSLSRDDRLEQAAQGFARSRAEDFSEDERKQCESWLNADASHRAAFR